MKERSANKILACHVCAVENPIPASGVEGYYQNDALQEVCGYLIEPSSSEIVQEETRFQTEVIFCRKHRTKALDRACMTCRNLICATCELDGRKHCEHSVILLENKNRVSEAYHRIQQCYQGDITARQRQLDLLQEALGNVRQLVNDTHEDFDLLEGKVLDTVRQIFRRSKELFLERFQEKQARLMANCELLKSSIVATRSLLSKMKSEQVKLSVLYHTFSSLNSVSLPTLEMEINGGDEKVSYNSELEYQLKLVLTKCVESVENIAFSWKRSKEREISPEILVNDERPETSTGDSRKPSRKGNSGSGKPVVSKKFKGNTSEVTSPKRTSGDKEVEIRTDLKVRGSPRVTQRKDESADSLVLIGDCHCSITGSDSNDKTFTFDDIGNVAQNEWLEHDIINAETKYYSPDYPVPFSDKIQKEVNPDEHNQTRETQNNTSLRKRIFMHESDSNISTFSQDFTVNEPSMSNESGSDTSSLIMPWTNDDDGRFSKGSISSEENRIKAVDEDLDDRNSFFGFIRITESESSSSTVDEKTSQEEDKLLDPTSQSVTRYKAEVVRTYGSKGRKPGQFNEPEGVAVGPNGNIYVVDSLNNRVQVFNSHLEFLFLFGKQRPGSLKKPFDVAVRVSDVTSNAVIVADKYNNKLQLFREDGEFLEAYGKKGRKNAAQFEGPSCVAVNSKGHMIISDTLNHRIQVIKINSEEDNEVFGNKADGYLSFCDPVGVAIDHNDNIIVADYGHDRVQILSPEGETLKVFGQGELSRPTHVAVSPCGNVFVSDSGNHRIQIFDSDGKFLWRFGSMGKEPGHFQQPGGMSWLSNGHLVVSDVDNCRLQIFDCSF